MSYCNQAIRAYFSFADNASKEESKTAFADRKNFGELVGKLTDQFNQRRSGYNDPTVANATIKARPGRRYPPMFETHPYLLRDDSDVRSVRLAALEKTLPPPVY